MNFDNVHPRAAARRGTTQHRAELTLSHTQRQSNDFTWLMTAFTAIDGETVKEMVDGTQTSRSASIVPLISK